MARVSRPPTAYALQAIWAMAIGDRKRRLVLSLLIVMGMIAYELVPFLVGSQPARTEDRAPMLPSTVQEAPVPAQRGTDIAPSVATDITSLDRYLRGPVPSLPTPTATTLSNR